MPEDTKPQQIQPPSQPASEPAGSTPSRTLLKITLIIIAAITTITLTGIGIIYFQLKNKPTASLDNRALMKLAEKLPIPKITLVPITLAPTIPSPQTTSQPSDAPTPTQDPAISLPIWKTYINKTHNFSIDYPSELTTQEKSHGLGVIDISFINPNSNHENSTKYQILIYPKSIGRLIGQDFDQFYALPQQSTHLMTSEATSPQQFTKTNNTKINNLPAFNFRTTSDPPDPDEETEIGTYIKLGENTLIISTIESSQTILTHMLSTFKSN